jgi:GMP synthase (glutamine-hydrolysing)
MKKILILDFGSQYTMLIARRVRELKVYCEIHRGDIPFSQVEEFAPAGIILSGGPASVLEAGAPLCDRKIFSLGVPILGICYGLQLMAFLLGGEVEKSGQREYGPATLVVDDDSDLFYNLRRIAPDESARLHHVGSTSAGGLRVWMSHGDRVKRLPAGFSVIAHSDNSPVAAMRDKDRRLYAVQFHPEVAHTPAGKDILGNFLFRLTGCTGDWTMRNFIAATVERIREKVASDKIIMGLSGGVDSTVAAMLIHKAVGDQLRCIFVDNGLLRKNEAEEVSNLFMERFNIPLLKVDAGDRFLAALAGLRDPEEKRKAVGRVFIEVFEESAGKIPGVKFLGQGTLYPDVIESVSFKGPSATIKSHHNVGGLPAKMNLALVEPLRELFKDEVRELGLELGLPPEVVWRQPFPGPGLAVRVVGEVTRERIELIRHADAIATAEIESWEGWREVWQYFTVLLPVQSVGVMGDELTYEYVAALRAVKSVDGMTADYADLPHPLLSRIASRIINEVKGINRVVYDISSKPPATIEWE